ncbi:MAG: sulfatase [Myxococcota bacterium]
MPGGTVLRRAGGVVLVGALVVFGLWRARERRDPVVDWAPDAEVRAEDLRILRGEAARMPSVWEPPEAPDIVVIVLDTVRADRMGVYGYGEGTTPNLDRWAAGARVFDRMVSDGAWTLPSHASLFTGMPVIAHGAHGTPRGEGLASPLAAGAETVAGALRKVGYRTAGIAANRAFLAPAWGLSQGFDLWLCHQLKLDRRRLPYVTGDRVTAMARAFLERRRDAPVFLFLNYMDAHAPWVPRRGYVRDPAALDRRFLPYGEGWERETERLLAEREADPAALATWSEAYDAELRFLDEHVGALLDALPALGVGPEDHVFVLSDHGEYLGEHALVEHSKDLYEEVLHVPLLVKGPGWEPGRDDTPVQTHDVASLVLAAAGQPPLRRAVRTERMQVSELYWSRQRDLENPAYGARFDRIRRAFRVGDRKLLLGSDGSREAYDLAADPAEAHAVTAAWVPELERAAEAWLGAQVAAPNAPVSAEADLEALRGLGYVE